MHPHVADILISEERIRQRLDELAGQLGRDYAGRELTIVGVLTGSLVFIADLVRRLSLPLQLDFIGISSYQGGTRPAGEFTVTKLLRLEVTGRDVLLVDDILDTGQTLRRVCGMLQGFGPRRVRTCVLLEKDVPHAGNITADYVAFRIPNRFVVGYGLDYQERYRNLPYVATLKETDDHSS